MVRCCRLYSGPYPYAFTDAAGFARTLCRIVATTNSVACNSPERDGQTRNDAPVGLVPVCRVDKSFGVYQVYGQVVQ